ncbi:PREDICTED: uncharacterized protein LOC109179596 [Ipomoea nil]|uniref:uncharacterized protein LOC109179596 n=1 Tax=Ipomoea nil TaxID=35883 RepID=UPI000900E7F0|nr:PREDICTED: uncharacterized protein LOC109179596 [Ipomoea nil]
MLNGNNNGGDVSRKITGCNPPSYLGQADPEVLENWIRTFDKTFDVVGYPVDQRVEADVYYFQEEADHWWVMEGPTIKEREGFDWEMFKTVLRERFYPEHVKAAKYGEFLHLEQGSSTVQEYHARFVALSCFAPTIALNEASKARKFVRGLHYDAQRLFAATKFATLIEAYDAAGSHSRIQQLQRDAIHGMKKKSEGNDSQSSKGHRFNLVARKDNQGGERKNPIMGQGVGAGGLSSVRSMVCLRCGKDHPRTTCGGRPMTCFNCGKPGHRAVICWHPKMKRPQGPTQSQLSRGQPS